MVFNELYQQINNLSVDAKKKTLDAEYQAVDLILAKRLFLLKTLAEKICIYDVNSSVYLQYHGFILELKQNDSQEIIQLLELRSHAIVENIQQHKRKKAVNAYRKVSQDK
jgi:hypothetical protein